MIDIWLIASPPMLHDVDLPAFVWNALICGIRLVVLGISVLCGTQPSKRR
ncbi:putative DNA-binding protein (UPF0278 family) [Rhizobium sp. BK196]|nr:SPW repeat protein [Rhizobium sp. BK377]MBB3312298.1 putative DNA-binding protein (UPF0278 family) [Rhizobium sp. BK196]MBB3463106.1 putative DNA-binding protein (UPF0278 family) [Rhizobium sp. BK377]